MSRESNHRQRRTVTPSFPGRSAPNMVSGLLILAVRLESETRQSSARVAQAVAGSRLDHPGAARSAAAPYNEAARRGGLGARLSPWARATWSRWSDRQAEADRSARSQNHGADRGVGCAACLSRETRTAPVHQGARCGPPGALSPGRSPAGRDEPLKTRGSREDDPSDDRRP